MFLQGNDVNIRSLFFLNLYEVQGFGSDLGLLPLGGSGFYIDYERELTSNC
jgi:hypothetical protein